MRFTYNVWHYVTLVSVVAKRGVRAVRNVFKKKNCGASPIKGEIILKGEEIERMLSFYRQRSLKLTAYCW